jgi:hypothetical protein
MKRMVLLVLVFLVGCSGPDPCMEAALDLRTRCLGAQTVRFQARICADYIDTLECFTLECTFDQGGGMAFSVQEPEDIGGIRGTVSENAGSVEFDGTVLAFPLLAEGRLSPVAAPWVLIKAIREGAILAAGYEGDMLRLTIDDSYADNALTVDVWLEDGTVEGAEIFWEGRRCVTMTLDDFSAQA